MLKLGICEANQDTPAHILWRRGLMAASMLAMSDPPTEAEKRRFDRLMPQITLSSGTTRSTARNRLARLDAEIQQCLQQVFAPDSSLDVEDWAVSNGITAVEWFLRLRKHYPHVRFTASDWILHLIEARYIPTGEIYILEPDGTPIQYIQPPFVVNLIVDSHWVYAVNRYVRRRAMRRWHNSLASRLRLPAQWEQFDYGPATANVQPFALRRLPLVHPEAVELLGPGFGIRRHSIFAALDTPVDVIRTMNILNRTYFPEARLREAIAAVERSLKPGGIWIVGRTVRDDPPENEVTIFRRGETGWQVLRRVGPGSEIEPLVCRV